MGKTHATRKEELADNKKRYKENGKQNRLMKQETRKPKYNEAGQVWVEGMGFVDVPKTFVPFQKKA